MLCKSLTDEDKSSHHCNKGYTKLVKEILEAMKLGRRTERRRKEVGIYSTLGLENATVGSDVAIGDRVVQEMARRFTQEKSDQWREVKEGDCAKSEAVAANRRRLSEENRRGDLQLKLRDKVKSRRKERGRTLMPTAHMKESA
jgi:hypothetical protein